MMSPQRITVLALAFACAIALACAAACGRPTGVPESSSGNAQKLPFDREPRSTGVSPSKSAIPATSRLPEGTSLAVRLRKRISSASARPGDSFEGTLDDAAVVEGQTLIARGAMVSGRVLDAKRSSGAHAPGYLRITLITINVQGETYLIDTSSIFAKGGPHDERPSATGAAPSSQTEAVIPADRRLTFRLAQAIDLQ
jgi:hypothetical protein